jgi:hypothetical protein
VLTDHRNPPLTLTGVRYTAPARQVIVEASEELAGPLRVYFGNPRAGEPHYDFARLLPDTPPPATRLEWLDPAPQRNPVYQPLPRPWTERWPWLVYVVLGAASLVLLGILITLGRQAIARHDRQVATA